MAILPLTQAFPNAAEDFANPLQTQVAEIFEQSRDDVYRYLLLQGLHPPQAQEATQEVFLRLYTTMRKGEDIREPRAWIFRVAHNLATKVRASQNAQPYDPEIEMRLTSSDNPERSLLERERIVRLHQALGSLSEQQRRCIFLRMEGLRYPEIGAALGISASTVGEFLRRGLARLKKVTHE
ncbi:MAG: sigma-70 family RNA polymerase sigma factor [Bryobacterales bacterium]|nr:sigma-70 family RNA polymerase sigma factor [Bryobacterales bacterium]